MFCPTVRPVNFYINVSVVSASQNLPPSIARTRLQRSELSTRRDFSSKAYQEEDTGPAAELYLSFSHINLRQTEGSIFLCGDGRLDQPLSPAFPSGLAGASLRDISDGYRRVARPHIKPLLL